MALFAVVTASAPGSPAGNRVIVELAAVALPHQVVKVAAARDGILSEVLVERGDEVKSGQVLARLDRTVEDVSLELARANASADAAIQLARITWKHKRGRLRQQEGLRAEGLVTDEALDATRTEAELAEWSLRNAEEEQQRARLELKRAEVLREQAEVRSSVAGVVTRRYLAAGELATRSGQATILEVAQLDPLRIELNVPQELRQDFTAARVAEVIFPQLGEQTFTARVVVVDRVVDTATGTFGVRLELPNPGYELPAGMECDVKVLR